MPALKSREHVLVCLSSSPSNAKIIRAAARMAQAFHARFSALYVHNEDTPVLGEEDQKRLEENMRLANRLGADLETGYGNDISEQIGEFARIAHVTKIVAGRSGRKSAFSHPFSLMEKLSESAPEAELYIIPDAGIMQKTGMGKIRHAFAKLPSLKEWLPVFANAALATLLAALFSALHLSEASIIAIYIFCVLISAIQCPNLLLCAGSAVLNMALFLYCFAAPRFSLHFWDGGYIITFLILLSTALLTGRLSQKRKAQVSLSRQAALRSGLLYEISQNLLAASSVEQIQELTARSAGELLRLDTVFYTNENGTLSEPCFYGDENVFLSSKERAVALWTLKNNKRAGAGTDTLSAASALYLAVRHSHHVYGVLGISLGKRRLSPDENSTVLSILDECALALENQNNELEKKKAYAQAEREKLKASLLRSIGHDLRTPLTAICGSADVLLSGTCAPEQQRKLLGTIHDDAFWLSQIVENLLSITRLEEGGLQIHQQPEVLDEVVEEALAHVHGNLDTHSVRIDIDEGCAALMDGRLMVQVMINLIENALKYTPEDSEIAILGKVEDGQLVIEVADNGPGIPEKDKEKIFESFFTGHALISDASRSMGLGLALCRLVLEAHHGSIEVTDNEPGARFVMKMPAMEVQI